jgi:hypothetical protein
VKFLMTVDIAHPALPARHAEEVLDESLRKVRLSPHLRVLKVIHGYGSHGTGGTLKTTVKNWIHKHRHEIISSIDGEDLTPLNAQVQVLAAECQLSLSKDLGAPNEGVTIVWIT